MKRFIATALNDWKNSNSRRVLLLRGARQVGKTYSIRELGKEFDAFIELNFEKDTSLNAFFEGPLDPRTINQKLSAYTKKEIVPGRTLLFLDEIQACPNALRALRYYHEDLPELHVAAAGSLLEFALSEIPSFGVGRITSLFMFPLSFAEFLLALDEGLLRDFVLNHDITKSIDQPLHNKLLDYVRVYELLGGMPFVIKAFLEKQDLIAGHKALAELVVSLTDDFAKYKKRLPATTINETFRSIALQTGSKFKYTNVSQALPAYQYKQALELLVQASLCQKITHTSASGIPLGATIDPKKFKAQLCDLGIHQNLLGTNVSLCLTEPATTFIHKGHLAELFVGLELLAYSPAYQRSELFYWHRESRSSNAEVDYVIQQNSKIIPVEVKSGTSGRMQSLHLFLKEKNLPLGLRISHENFGRIGQIQIIPIYAVEKIMKMAW